MSQILDRIPINELTEDHLISLQLLRVSEDPRLEFKAELKMSTDADKRELCKDLSALANSQGGYILFGVSEDNGVVSGIPGIGFTDTEQQQFMQITSSGIKPRLQSVAHNSLPLQNGNRALVVKVEPDGYLHQVKCKNDNRYYKRTGTITIAMESSDIEFFYTSKGPSDRKEEIEKFIENYHGALRSKQYFKGVSGQGICAVTIVPEVASYKLDFGNLPRNINSLFPPMDCTGWNHEITGRARFTFDCHRDKQTPYAVTEITELGELKAFNSSLLEYDYRSPPLPENVTGYVPSIAYERELINSIHQYLTSFTQLGVSPPFFVNIAFVAVRGYIMYVDAIYNSGRVLSQDDVRPPSIKFSTEAEFASREAVAKVLHPAFDFIWREFGFQRSINFTSDGDWAHER